MPKPEPATYRVCYTHNGHWTAYVTRTGNPQKVVDALIGHGLHRDDILVELRPGKGIKMPMPKGPQTPKVTTGG